MRRYLARIRNFYDVDDDDVGVRETSHIGVSPASEDEAEPQPRPSASIQPTAHHGAHSPSTSLRHYPPQRVTGGSGSGSESSASIEDVIPCAPTDRRSPPSEYVSLRELEAAVAEAERDVRRLRALMVKAVWHALTQTSDNNSGGGGAQHKKGVHGDATTLSSRRAGAHGSANARNGRDAIFASEASLSTFCNSKPFLPPDRYPTLPDLEDSADHLQVNLSRALFAASRAGLLEKQRAWLQHRHTEAGAAAAAPDGTSLPAAPATAEAASARQTALQRISSISGANAKSSSAGLKGQRTRESRTTSSPSAAASSRLRAGAVGTTANDDDAQEARVQCSVSLVILRVAKDRAVATLFLRQLRLDTYRRQLLREHVALRYTYYVLRRTLRNWHCCAQQQRAEHAAMRRRVVEHWRLFVEHRRALRAVVRAWRCRLQQRARAFAACQLSLRRRCLQRWARAFTWRRERSSLYDMAAHFAAARRASHLGPYVNSEVLHLLHGTPVAAVTGAVVATPVGHRLLLQRLFQLWKRRTEWHLMAHLAQWHHVQLQRRRVVRVVCARARVLALRAHRLAQAAQQRAAHVNAADTPVNVADQPVVAPARAPPRVHLLESIPRALLKYKLGTAAQIAHVAQLRACLQRWQTRSRHRRADRFRVQSVQFSVLRRWLHAVTRHRQQREWKAVVWVRWVAAVRSRRDVAAAAHLHSFLVLQRAFAVWRTRYALRLTTLALTRRGCFDKWRERAAVRGGLRTLRRAKLRRLLTRWHARAQTRLNTRANLYVAATLWETGLLLGCVRRWRDRAMGHRRSRLAWEVLTQLRHEHLCRCCFARWQRRTFGPASAIAPPNPRVKGIVASPTVSFAT